MVPLPPSQGDIAISVTVPPVSAQCLNRIFFDEDEGEASAAAAVKACALALVVGDEATPVVLGEPWSDHGFVEEAEVGVRVGKDQSTTVVVVVEVIAESPVITLFEGSAKLPSSIAVGASVG